MLNLFRWLFGGRVVKIEVTVNVSPIRVITTGPEIQVQEAKQAGGGSELSGSKEGYKLNSAPRLTDDERLKSLEERLSKKELPTLSMGEDREDSKDDT